MKPIYIHKGDDTVFGQITKFLSFKIVTSDDLGGYKAEFRLRRIIKKINSLDNNEFEVILTAEETNKLEYGKCFGEIKLVDPEGHIKTFCNTIPFVITPKVIDSQEGVIELELTNSPEYSLILKIGDNTAGVSNYADLKDKPQINGVELVGNLTTEDLKIDIDTSNLATKEELKEVENKIPDVDNLATKDEIPTVPTKVSDLENDSGFISDISGAIKGGKYVDVYKSTGETLYEYKSVFDETNIGMVTANNVTCFTDQFDYIINNMSEITQLEQPVSEMYGFKLKEEQIDHIVPMLKADKTPYTLLECINDNLFIANGVTDLTRENKVNMLNLMTGGNVDPDAAIYAIQMKTDSPFFSSCLLSVYQDNFGNYIIGIYVGWHVTPVSETQVGGSTGEMVVDLNSVTAQKINKNTSDIEALNTKVDNLPTGGAEYTAGSGIDITDNVISSSVLNHKGRWNYSTTYNKGDIVYYEYEGINTSFISLSDSNVNNTPNVRAFTSNKWNAFNSTMIYAQHTVGGKDDVPVCTIKNTGTSGGTIPTHWEVYTPRTLDQVALIPTINLVTGVMKAPAGIEGYYTAADIDAKLGDIETLLSEI